MLRRKVSYFMLFMAVCTPQVHAAAPASPMLLVATADSAAQNDASQGDDAQQVQEGDPAEQKSAGKQMPARREPEPLTFSGAIGLILIICAIGGFSYWALRSMSGTSEDDEESKEQQA